MTTNDTTKLKKYVSYVDQVREVIREKLISGEFSHGEKMPSLRKIAADLGTNPFTVQKALNALQNEGLLISYPRRGSFAQKREEKLTCVGVYCTTDVKGSPYAHAVREALSRELHEAGIEMDLWMDPRPKDQFGEPWAPLVKAAEQRQFQAFIATEIDLPLLQWQRKLPVPLAFLDTPPSVPNSVVHDMRQFVEIGLQELARQGCRSVGFISPVLPAFCPSNPEENIVASFRMLGHLTDIAGDLGLTVKNDWMRVVNDQHLEVRGQEQFGHEQFLELWNQPAKPEGLLVFSDVIARGVLMAIERKHVRVPEDLKLVLHKNESIDLFCPMPATFVVSSEREVARALIGQVQKQFNGETCERISLPFKIVAHNNP